MKNDRITQISERIENMKPQPMGSPKIGGADARALYIQDADYLLTHIRKQDEMLEVLASALDSCETRLLYFETLPGRPAFNEHAKSGREKATAALARLSASEVGE